MKIKQVYNFRIYPTKAQEILLNKTFGCCRKIFNCMLEKIKNKEKRPTEAALKKIHPFLKEVDSIALQQSRRNLENAFKNLREGRANYPKFKSRKSRQSFRTVRTQGNIKINFSNNTIKIPKCTPIKFRDERMFEEDIRQVTVSKTKTGRYYAAILIDQEILSKKLDKITEDKVIGLDMSCGHIYVDSNRYSPKNPKFFRKYEIRLARAQRAQAKKKKDSKNREKQRIRVAKIHEKIKFCRLDFLHKLSTEITNQFDAVCVEDLNIKGMLKGLHLAKSFMDNAWSIFTTFLEYKLLWKGKIFLKADRFFPSSKLCNNCSFKNTDLKLEDRDWVCPACGTYLNRDHNAALNLKKYLISTLGTRGFKACGDCVRPLPLPLPTVMVQATVCEAGSLAL